MPSIPSSTNKPGNTVVGNTPCHQRGTNQICSLFAEGQFGTYPFTHAQVPRIVCLPIFQGSSVPSTSRFQVPQHGSFSNIVKIPGFQNQSKEVYAIFEPFDLRNLTLIKYSRRLLLILQFSKPCTGKNALQHLQPGCVPACRHASMPKFQLESSIPKRMEVRDLQLKN